MIATDKSRFGTIAAIGVGAVVTVALLFGATAVPTQAQTDAQIIQQLQQQIAALQAQLQSLVGGGDTSGGTAACTATFTRNLTVGSQGADVLNLQKAFNSDPDTQLAISGPGSPGNETEFFGPITRSGALKFQNKHSAEVLAPLGLSNATGYVGPSTRAKLNEICSGSTTGGQTPGTGTGITVSANSQPSNGLFPQNAARVPFTNFTVTNNGSSDVTINSVVVEKTGLIDRDSFSEVLLADNNQIQLGDARSLNSNNQATIGRSITIPAGATRTFTVAANAPSSLGTKAGQVGGLSVVAINTNASLSGSLPITGAAHTVNATLAIGTADTDRGTNDPNTNRSLEIGSTDYTFSSVRVTAGSEEDLRLHSVRWTQNGSIDSSDLANLMVHVNGTTYPVSVSGDEYTATFGGGILIEEGFSKDIAIRGDIVGDANGDTVQFDLEEASDVHVTGETFGYGILPTFSGSTASAGDGSQFTTSGNPFYDASQVTVTGGSVSTISKSNAVPAQNVAINVANQPLGAFSTNLTGEGLEVDGITFGLKITGGDNGTDITSVTLVDENGSVVAGPVDGTNAGTGENGEIVFSDLIEFPTGSNTYTLKGRLSTDFTNGNTIQATTTVSSTYWTDPEGAVTGDAYTLPGTTVNMNTMTVNAADLNISVASTPSAQNVVAGASDFTFAKYILDTTSSGEDVRFNSLPLRATGTGIATSTDINSCQLFDGSTVLNTGSNVVNGSDINSGSDTTFTFTNSLTVPKGMSKTLEVRCNIASGASGTFSWGINSGADPTVTGVQSGASVSENITTATGQTMTISSSGTVTVSIDSSDPSERWYVGGDEATVGVFELLTTNEAFSLRDIELALDTASSSSSDIAEIALYDGSTQLVRKLSPAFTSNTELFSNLGFDLPKDDDKNITVKVKFGEVGVGQAGQSGALVRFSTSTSAANNEAQGIESGTVVTLDDSEVATTTGARYFRALPNVARVSDASRALLGSTDETLYEFSVTATGDDVAVNQFTLDVATTAASVTNLDLIEVDSGKSVATLSNLAGNTATFTFAASGSDYTNAYLEIGEGETKTFRLEGDVTDDDTGNATGRVTVKLNEDSSYPSLASGLMGTVSTVSGSNFVWSPLSTTTDVTATDWTNAYRVPGLEFGDLEGTTSSGL